MIFYFIYSFQVKILLRELCRLHNVPLPSETESLSLPAHMDISPPQYKQIDQASGIDDSDCEGDEIEDATLESEPESEVDEDLSLEMDDGRNANKVNIPCFTVFVVVVVDCFSVSIKILLIGIKKNSSF